MSLIPEFDELQSRGIRTADSADWLLSLMARIEAEKSLLKKQHAHRMAQLESDLERLNRRFAVELEVWAQEEIFKRGNQRKSVVLPHGTIQFRRCPERLRITDDVAALEHAKATGILDAVRMTLKASEYLAEAKEVRFLHGELIPGVEIDRPHEKMSISFGSLEGDCREEEIERTIE